MILTSIARVPEQRSERTPSFLKANLIRPDLEGLEGGGRREGSEPVKNWGDIRFNS